MKIITRLLVILVFGIVCSVTTLIFTNHSSNNRTPVEATINQTNEIQKDVVIEKLSSKSQIVGLFSTFTKGYSYNDKTFFGNRSFTLTIHGNFKMGFEVSELLKNITIKDTTIVVVTPHPVLISFEVPFDKATIESDVDFFRHNFNKDDFQLFYKHSSDKAREEIIVSKYIAAEAQKRTQKVVRDLLMTVHNVSKVEFISY